MKRHALGVLMSGVRRKRGLRQEAMGRRNNQGRWMNEENMKTGILIDTRCGGQQGRARGGHECDQSDAMRVSE